MVANGMVLGAALEAVVYAVLPFFVHVHPQPIFR